MSLAPVAEMTGLEPYSGDRDREKLPLVWAKDVVFDPHALPEIVEDVFIAGGMSVTYGETNSGKTTLMLDLALRMPTELPWLGKRVRRGAVVYVAAESPQSVRLRLEAFRRHHQEQVGAFAMVPIALSLLEPSADVGDLIDLVGRADSLAMPVRLVVVDTVSRVIPGANENASEDMSRLVASCDRIRETCGVHVNLVHHSGKDAAKGARGHSLLRAAVDTELEVTFDPLTKLHALEVTKQRDLASKGTTLAARFKSIELATNQWGNPITACVVVPHEPESAHIQAVMQRADDERAEEAVLNAFVKLGEQGIHPSDTTNSQDYLPRAMLKKNLGNGFGKDELEAAMHRLMTRGTFIRGVIGRYPNRSERQGLICTK